MSKPGDDLLTGIRAQEALHYYPLLQPLRSLGLRRAFLDELFELNVEFDLDNRQAVDATLETFFPRYEALCELAVKRDRRAETVTHWELLEVIRVLKDQSKARFQLEELIRAQRGLEVLGALISVLLELAASTWLLMSIGSDYPGIFSHSDPIPWHGEESFLLGVVRRQFPQRFESSDIVKLPQTFTAAQLELIGGIAVDGQSGGAFTAQR